MAVAHDAATESSVSASQASFSWTHTPSGTPRAALVFVLSIQSTGDDTSVTYGGIAMTLLPYSGSDTDTEPGTIRAYFLDGVPSGAQTVLVNRVNDATSMIGNCVTVTAATACEPYLPGVITQGGSSQNTAATTSGTGTGASGEVAVDDGSPGTDSMRYQAHYTGAATPLGAGTNSTSLHTHDFTSFGWTLVRETTAGQGSRSVGVATGTTDDRASVAVAIREYPPPIETRARVNHPQILAH
jgi:hypothetical protein